MPTLAYHATAAASAANLTKYSELTTADPNKTQQITGTLSRHTPQLVRMGIQLWSAHSIRVGASAILHAMGFTASQIQFILRWKSMAFLVYLRNLSILSTKQNTAIHDVSRMPNFL